MVKKRGKPAKGVEIGQNSPHGLFEKATLQGCLLLFLKWLYFNGSISQDSKGLRLPSSQRTAMTSGSQWT